MYVLRCVRRRRIKARIMTEATIIDGTNVETRLDAELEAELESL
jgi:hypothetical protein